MLLHYQGQVFQLTGFGEMHLTFAISDIFLEIKGYCLGLTKILQIFRNGSTQVGAQFEEVIHRCPRRKNNRGIVGDKDFLLSKFFGRQRFYLNERTEVESNAIFFLDIEIWRFLRSRAWLRYQYLLNFQGSDII